jgi:hypothetical protein
MKSGVVRTMVLAVLFGLVLAGLVVILPGDDAAAQQGQSACPSWPAQRTHNLSASELSGCECWDLEILRNEIYARHGRIFNRKDLQEYFSAQPWYSPDPSNPEGKRGQTKTEQRNATFILSIEKGRGCRN